MFYLLWLFVIVMWHRRNSHVTSPAPGVFPPALITEWSACCPTLVIVVLSELLNELFQIFKKGMGGTCHPTKRRIFPDNITYTPSDLSVFLYKNDIFRYFSFKDKKEMGQSIQEWTKENLRKTAFKKFEVIWSAWSAVVVLIRSNHSHTKGNSLEMV